MMKLDVDFVRLVFGELKVVPSIVERENSVTVGNHMLYSHEEGGRIVYYVEQNGNEDEIYSSDNYRFAVLAMMQSHVYELVQDREEMLATEGMAESFREDERLLQKAFDEGYEVGFKGIECPNPYSYGIDHHGKWNAGRIQGRYMSQIKRLA